MPIVAMQRDELHADVFSIEVDEFRSRGKWHRLFAQPRRRAVVYVRWRWGWGRAVWVGFETQEAFRVRPNPVRRRRRRVEVDGARIGSVERRFLPSPFPARWRVRDAHGKLVFTAREPHGDAASRFRTTLLGLVGSALIAVFTYYGTYAGGANPFDRLELESDGRVVGRVKRAVDRPSVLELTDPRVDRRLALAFFSIVIRDVRHESLNAGD